jgi:hypothetical protein
LRCVLQCARRRRSVHGTMSWCILRRCYFPCQGQGKDKIERHIALLTQAGRREHTSPRAWGSHGTRVCRHASMSDVLPPRGGCPLCAGSYIHTHHPCCSLPPLWTYLPLFVCACHGPQRSTFASRPCPSPNSHCAPSACWFAHRPPATCTLPLAHALPALDHARRSLRRLPAMRHGCTVQDPTFSPPRLALVPTEHTSPAGTLPGAPSPQALSRRAPSQRARQGCIDDRYPRFVGRMRRVSAHVTAVRLHLHVHVAATAWSDHPSSPF